MKYGKGTNLPLAQQDLLNIRQYIETELVNPVAARRTLSVMLKAIRQLEQFPLSGRPCSIIEQTQGIAM